MYMREAIYNYKLEHTFTKAIFAKWHLYLLSEVELTEL